MPSAQILAKIKESVMTSVVRWLKPFARISYKDGDIGKMDLNILQERVLEAYEYCQANGLPCRIIILKPRQRGSTTFAVLLMYWISRARRVKSLVVGGVYKHTKNAWDILKTYAKYDRFPWPTFANILNDKATFGTGSKILQETAKDSDAGRSGTYQVMILTEVGLWKAKGVANAADVVSGLLKCVGPDAGTLIIMDSTSGGPGGVYFNTWQNGVTIEQFMKGRRGNGFMRIFAGWFEFPECTVPDDEMEPGELNHIYETLDNEEKSLMATHGCSVNQLAWRRRAILSECDGDVLKFDRDYPATPSHAFRAGGICRFSREGLAWNESVAKLWESVVTYGNLEEVTQRRRKTSVFIAADEQEGDILVFEKPVDGLSYLLCADTMRGASRSMGADPDRMAVFVLRDGYYDAERRWRPPAVAARIKSPCIWDVDITAETIAKLSRYYGRCMVVVEDNNDAGVIEYLKNEGDIPMFRQTVRNKRTQKIVETYGFKTNESSREFLLKELAKAIRTFDEIGGGIELRCPNAISECSTFVKSETGKFEAMEDCKDDDVLALGIGVACLGSATRYRVPLINDQPNFSPDGGRRGDMTNS